MYLHLAAEPFTCVVQVPGLAEARPSVMVGDALFVRPSGTAEGSREFKGYVHRIHLETVCTSENKKITVMTGDGHINGSCIAL